MFRPSELADMQNVPRFKIEEFRRHLFKLLDLQSNSNFCLLENGGKGRVGVQTQSTLTRAEVCLGQETPALGAPADETDHPRGNDARAHTDPRGGRVGCVHVRIPQGVSVRAQEGEDSRNLPQLPPSRR